MKSRHSSSQTSVSCYRPAQPYPRAATPAPWPRVTPTWLTHAGRNHARGHQSCSPVPWPPQSLASVACHSSPLGTGSGRNRPRVSRRGDRSVRRRLSALVGRKRVGEPHSFSSTTRATRRPRPWAPEPALPASDSGAQFPGPLSAESSTATSRIRGGLGLVATVCEDVLRVGRDPHIGQERLQLHLVRRQGDQ
jgi:hypothetical protein